DADPQDDAGRARPRLPPPERPHGRDGTARLLGPAGPAGARGAVAAAAQDTAPAFGSASAGLRLRLARRLDRKQRPDERDREEHRDRADGPEDLVAVRR